MQQLEVSRSDMRETRITQKPRKKLHEGEVRVRIDQFALTSNNVTYAAAGDRMGYWQFFPIDDEWGLVPVWGFADVIESRCRTVDVGERLFGFFPMAEEATLVAARLGDQVVEDYSRSRIKLHPFYNRYACVHHEKGYSQKQDALRALLYPLYATAFCLHDYLAINDWFGANQVIITSASSKTAIGLASALSSHNTAPVIVGLTSEKHKSFALGLQTYDRVDLYEDIAFLAKTKSIVVDMSGNQGVLQSLLSRLGGELKHCVHVGLTHWQSEKSQLSFKSDQVTRFFVPSYLMDRIAAPVGQDFLESLDTFWRDLSEKSREWLHVEKVSGLQAAEKLYAQLCIGGTSPATGIAVSL